MDYNSLTTQIAQTANRNDAFFINQIPNFINQGINRIYSEAKNIGFQKVETGTITQGVTTIDKPLDWKETISLRIAIPEFGFNFLKLRAYEFCILYAPDSADEAEPIFYADLDLPSQAIAGKLYIAPTPDQDYDYELTYLGLPLFDGNEPTNFLTDRYPNLLLYACMLEAVPFLKDDERVPVFESFYNRALQSINRESSERIIDKVSKRDKS